MHQPERVGDGGGQALSPGAGDQEAARGRDAPCCQTCAWYCVRTGFCRKFPPQVVMQYVDRMAFPAAAFPKIQVPSVDWCSYFAPRPQVDAARGK